MTEKFELMPIQKPDAISSMLSDASENNAAKDFAQSQAAMKSVVDVGSQAVRELGLLASASQDSDHYAALASLIKTVSDASSTLLKIHKQLDEVKIKDNVQKQEFHNHLHFNGSTAELAQALKRENK